ncbi:MAG: winged helix-turn-helix domain-containing protein [Butyricicoccaceae bacterium]
MIKGGANNRDVKKINRIRTMRSIFACERISQPELAAKVGNSWPTVLQNVKELMEMGLVQGSAPSSPPAAARRKPLPRCGTPAMRSVSK